MSVHKGWIAVDLDGTLAVYDVWRGAEHIGAPVPRMVERVKAWLAAGDDVRIFTARIAPSNTGRDLNLTIAAIDAWCLEHIGQKLVISCVKDMGMIQLWDDRAVQVIPNTGLRADGAGL